MNINTWLLSNLQKWTPFAVMCIIVVSGLVFLLLWDALHGITPPAGLYVILSILLGGTGGLQAVSHGVTIANGVAQHTAEAVVSAHEAINQNQEVKS